MAALTQDDRRDIARLRSLLRSIRALLSWLVQDSNFVPRDIRGAFGEVLPLVQKRLDAADNVIGSIKNTDNEVWRRLDEAGLTGIALNLKWMLWRRTGMAAAAAPPIAQVVPASRGFVARKLQPLLKLTNSLLGSFLKAIPGVELVKEYKEGVEVVVADQQRGLRPSPKVFDIRDT